MKNFILCLFPAMLLQAGGIRDVASKADAIVVGSITTRLESTDRVSFDIVVQRVLKGGALPTVIHVNHRWTRRGMVSPRTIRTYNATFFGVWALQRTDGSTTWNVLVMNGTDGFMPALFLPAELELPSSYQYPSNVPLTDALAFEVGAGVKRVG